VLPVEDGFVAAAEVMAKVDGVEVAPAADVVAAVALAARPMR
jgi:hypothetical protein